MLEPSRHFLLHAAINDASISQSIGLTEYSYYFVLKDFVPVLERMGEVHVVKDPGAEVDALYRDITDAGGKAVFLNFTAPHNLVPEIQCPTVHVFAWEFDTLPTDSWLADGLQDWRFALGAHARAITHSQYAKNAIEDAMGPDFPVAVVPCPVWDKFALQRERFAQRGPLKDVDLHFEGRVFDTRQIELFVDLDSHHLRRSREAAGEEIVPAEGGDISPGGLLKKLAHGLTPPLIWRFLERRLAWARSTPTEEKDNPTPQAPSQAEIDIYTDKKPNALKLEGVVYTSIFNPLDGRKNWRDMISAFVWAHKDNKDATLVLKTPNLDVHDFIDPLISFLKAFLPFDCRIVVLKAYLKDGQYESLLEGTSYYVNTSFGEGQCLPLMEYLSAGVPAIAPDSTALADYINPEMAFVVPSHAEPSTWQHDPRLSYRALRYRVDWLKLVEAFKRSYEVAHQDPSEWRRMGQAAMDRMSQHCSLAVAEAELAAFFATEDPAGAVIDERGSGSANAVSATDVQEG